MFLAAGWAYGKAAGTIKSQKDLIDMMSEAMKDMGYYLVLMFAAAHFVAMFNWSNLGLVSAVHGADAIQSSGLPLPIVLGLIVLFAGLLNLFVGSSSAKWALLAPVLVPMLLALRRQPGCRDSCLPRRRRSDEYHYAAYGLFPACLGLRAALDKEFRHRLTNGHDDSLLDLDALYGGHTCHALDYAGMGLWPRSTRSALDTDG